MSDTTLYFAYTSMIAPGKISNVAPDAAFRFIAHLPETRLIFTHETSAWTGSLPSVRAEPGNTVWGAVFEVDNATLDAITAFEETEGRRVTYDFKAVDREGKRHSVVTHVFSVDEPSSTNPSREYMGHVVIGGRHWSLPAGWVAGLEEYLDDPLI